MIISIYVIPSEELPVMVFDDVVLDIDKTEPLVLWAQIISEKFLGTTGWI